MRPSDLAELRRDYGPWAVPRCPKCGGEQEIVDDGSNVMLVNCPACRVTTGVNREYAEDPRVLALCDRIDSRNDLVYALGRTLDRTADDLRRVQRELDEAIIREAKRGE